MADLRVAYRALHLGHVAQSFALSAPPNAFRSRFINNNKSSGGAGAQKGSNTPATSSYSAQAGVSAKAFPMNRNKNASQKTLSNPYANAMRNEFDAGL